MSEQKEKPEVLPGDLITRPGLYESRSQGVVEVRHWGRDGWVAQWGDKERIYFSDGTRTGLYPMPDPYQLLHWVGPLPASEPEPETTSEQLAEIEGQAEQPPQPQPIQVREGRWRTQGGDIRNVTPTPSHDSRAKRWPWRDAKYDQTWTPNGQNQSNCEESPLDLVEYLGPIEPQPQPEKLPEGCRNDGGWSSVSGIQSEPWPQPRVPQDADQMIRLLSEANHSHVAMIGRLQARINDLETINAATTAAFDRANKANDALRAQVRILQQEADKKNSRIEFLETLNAGNGAAIDDYRAKVEKLQGLVDTARGKLEAAATECDELRAAIDAADKQLDQKDAQIRDLRIELDAARQVPQPVGDEERERIWDEATEQAGRQVVRWLRPLTLALNRQPDERFSRFMALTLSVLPDVLPELLGYAVEDESLDSDEDRE